METYIGALIFLFGVIIGSFLNVVDPETVDLLQKVAVEESKSGIPLVFARDVIHGFKTIFPKCLLASISSWASVSPRGR